jgi:hypothetical protein
MCGLAFYPGDYDRRCQQALDTACCSQENACAANPDCVKLLACINACPAPRTDACINTCSGDAGDDKTPGYANLDVVARCSKAPPYQEPAGIDCSWPVGAPDDASVSSIVPPEAGSQ